MSAATHGRRPRTAKLGLAVLILLALIALTFAVLYWMGTADDELAPATVSDFNDAQLIERGAYLARAGNCVTCHTARGGLPYAGGRAVPTPFGTIYGTNITPDTETGIGSWSADDFWRALHNGKSKDGRMLYPAFPYTEFTQVTRADADAIYAYLRSVPAVQQANTPTSLRFPYNQQFALALWRALYFRPQTYVADDDQDTIWNRGAYLTQGLGHCAACHTPRNRLGAGMTKADLAGGMIPMLAWYAPPLTGNAPNGLGDWTEHHVAELLKTGINPSTTASGPMADVIFQSLQYLTDDDAQAMARYLKSLPASKFAPQPGGTGATNGASMTHGARLYETHCLDCHGAQGEGRQPAYPPLANNISVIAPTAVNAIRSVLNGGYAPGTATHPQPHGMPPFRQTLSDVDVAAVVTYIRGSWGNQAGAVTSAEVRRNRGVY